MPKEYYRVKRKDQPLDIVRNSIIELIVEGYVSIIYYNLI
jgi:hypothetical protein